MEQPLIYHNPKCSKSRATLQLLTERGYHPQIIDYLKNPLSKEMLSNILTMLGNDPLKMIRTKESIFKGLGLINHKDTEELLAAIADHPILLERPIVVYRGKAAIGRPPEAVLEILTT